MRWSKKLETATLYKTIKGATKNCQPLPVTNPIMYAGDLRARQLGSRQGILVMPKEIAKTLQDGNDCPELEQYRIISFYS